MWQNFLLFKGRIIFHCMYIPYCLSTHPLIDTWIVSAFWLLWIMLLEHGRKNLALYFYIYIFPSMPTFVLDYISVSKKTTEYWQFHISYGSTYTDMPQRNYEFGPCITDHCNEANISIKWITQIFWLPTSYRTYVYTTL